MISAELIWTKVIGNLTNVILAVKYYDNPPADWYLLWKLSLRSCRIIKKGMKGPTRFRIRIINPTLPWILLGLLVIFLLDSYRGWLILLIGLGGVWVFSLFWARMLAKNLGFSREMRFGWAQVGDRLEERFTLTNLGWLPALWVEVIYQSNMPEYQPGRIAAVGGTSEQTWRSEGLCTKRGLFSLGPVTIQTGDPFGLFHTRLEFSGKTTILVTPPIVSLPEVEIAPGGRAGDGSARKVAREPTVSAAGVRGYRPGDTLRHIHWPTSVRKGSYFVRLFDHAPSSDWFILLDLNGNIQNGEGFYSTEEHGVILAASLTDLGLRAGHAVGMGINGNKFTLQPPRFGEAQRQNIMRSLALASTGTMSLSELLEKGRALIHYNTSLVIITADSQGGWLDGLVSLIDKGTVATVFLIDADTYLQAVPVQQDDRKLGEEKTHSDTERLSPAVQRLSAFLNAHNIVHYPFTRSFLDRPETRPGKQGHWQWSRASSNRAVLKDRPGDLDWRALE
jgi:uncharacterized protein (DUF58 family)